MHGAQPGTLQGGGISLLAANLYMHYVFHLWVQRWRRTEARGDMIIVRDLDDFIVEIRKEAQQLRCHHVRSAAHAEASAAYSALYSTLQHIFMRSEIRPASSSFSKMDSRSSGADSHFVK